MACASSCPLGLLLFSLPSTTTFSIHPPPPALPAPHTLCRRCLHPRLSESKPPPEVVEAERKATPMRQYRFAGIGVLGGLCGASAILSVLSIAGQPDAVELGADLLPFGNPYLALVGDVAIGGTCAWAWAQEVATRETNVQRIWEEVKRRRAGGAASGSGGGANRFERRAAKGGKGMATAAPSRRVAAPSPPPPPPPPPPPAAAAPGLFSQAQSMFEEANTLAKAQAEALNKNLEERGVLPPISQSQPPATAEQVDAADAASAKTTSPTTMEATTEASAQVPVAASTQVLEEAPANSVAQDSVAKGGKGKKKSKRARKGKKRSR